MPGEVFYWVFNMSIIASVTGVLMLPVRSVKRIPRRLTVFLWLIPYFRMTVPVGFNSPYSLMSWVSRMMAKTIVAYQPAEDVSFSMMNCVEAANSYFPITYKADMLGKIFGAASVIWIMVLSALLLALAVMYFTTLRAIKNAVHLRDRIYLSDKISSPAVYGIIHPKILLPVSYQEKDIELIMLHETMHIRRADNLWRMLAFLIAAVHWFNPLCWVFLKLFLEDLELSCDERVLVRLGSCRAKEYALSLLESGRNAPTLASAFGGAKLRARIENILSFKRMTWFSLTVFLLLLITIGYVLLTNAG